MQRQGEHQPVLYAEVMEGLALSPGQTVCDGTLGGGGHARGIVAAIGPNGTFIGIDRDEDAIDRVSSWLHGENIHIVHADFSHIQAVLTQFHVKGLDGALLDLGVSSYQLEDVSRGFSYMLDAPLDMRMDLRDSFNAAQLVNEASKADLKRILRDYGEERWADRIASFIVSARSEAPIETTGELVSIIKAAIPKGARRDGPHPAKRSFQALRIAVNHELEPLARTLQSYVNVLKPGGRLAVITFHSLEDRIVKNEFRRLADPCECPKDFPVCVCGKTPQAKPVNRHPITASPAELEANPRSRSAKLRVIERI